MTYSTLRPWANGISGNTAVLFALMLMPIFAVSGFAIDASRQVSLKNHVQSATDAAALAGARTFAASFDAAVAAKAAKHAFNANVKSAHGDKSCSIKSIVPDLAALTVSVEAVCKVPTVFGVAISGQSSVKAEVTSTAGAVTKVADVAMMFDLSGSMTATELGHLKVAGKRAAELIIGSHAGVTGRVAIAPFATGVNAGEFGNKVTGRSAGDDPESDDRTAGGLTIDRVCVTERVDAYGLGDWTDAKPIFGAYIGGVSGGVWDPAPAIPGVEASAQFCPDSPIHPLDGDLTAVQNAIDALARSSLATAVGSRTKGHMGVAWSWYLISPNWSSVWGDTDYGGSADFVPHPYGDPNRKKVVILMTDGIFHDAFHSAFTDSDTQETLVKNASLKMCDGMRAAGVVIYGIAYDAGPDALQMLKDCADDDTRVYEVLASADLEAVYESIAYDFVGIGLTQ